MAPDAAATAKYLSVETARARFDIGTTLLYSLIASGQIAARKCGRRLLIDADSADAYFAALPRAALTTGLARAARRAAA